MCLISFNKIHQSLTSSNHTKPLQPPPATPSYHPSTTPYHYNCKYQHFLQIHTLFQIHTLYYMSQNEILNPTIILRVFVTTAILTNKWNQTLLLIAGNIFLSRTPHFLFAISKVAPKRNSRRQYDHFNSEIFFSYKRKGSFMKVENIKIQSIFKKVIQGNFTGSPTKHRID